MKLLMSFIIYQCGGKRLSVLITVWGRSLGKQWQSTPIFLSEKKSDLKTPV